MPEPAPPTNNPPGTPPTSINPLGKAFESAMKEQFPDGNLPPPRVAKIGLQQQESQFGHPQPPAPPASPNPAPAGLPTTVPSPVVTPTGPPLSDPNEPVVTGPPLVATGPTGVASTGPTGPSATGPTATGPAASGPPTKEQLDAAEKAMPIAAGTAFKIVRKDVERLSKENEALQSKVEEAERRASEVSVDSKEVTELRERVAAQEKALAAVNVEATEDFQKTIAQPIKAAEKELERLATHYEVPITELRSALAEGDTIKRNELLSELSAKFNRMDTMTFDRTVVQLIGLQQAKADALQNAARTVELSQAERARTAAESAKTFEKQWAVDRDAALTELMTDKTAIGVIFTPTGDEKFDADVQAAIERVKGLDVNKLSNQQIAADLFRSHMLPLATRLIAAQHSQIAALQEEVEGLRGGTPPQGDGIPPTPPPPGQIPQGTTFADVARQKMEGVIPR